MEKYITSIKELVTQTIAGVSDIKAKAEDGDAESCFKMGMIHLLGINTSIDFKKAGNFFGNQALADNPVANRLIGFIAECEGQFAQAFSNYAKAGKGNRPHVNNVNEERNNLQGYFKKLNLPTNSLNKEVTEVLNEYIKEGDSNLDTKIKMAFVCEDERSCIEAAQSLFEVGDVSSAKEWLLVGNVPSTHPLYASIEKELSDTKPINVSNTFTVIEVHGNSLLSETKLNFSLAGIKDICIKESISGKQKWESTVSKMVNTIKNEIEKEEKDREKKKKDAEYQAYLLEQAEEAARRKRRNKMIKWGVAAGVVLLLVIFSAIGSNNQDSSNVATSPSNNTTVVEEKELKAETSKKGTVEEPKDEAPSMTDQKEIIETSGEGYAEVLSERKLVDSDLDGKTKKDLEILRNSIYAKYGYKFKREDLLNYFSQFSWYNPITRDMAEVYNSMSDVEKYNIDFIKKHE